MAIAPCPTPNSSFDALRFQSVTVSARAGAHTASVATAMSTATRAR